MWNYVIFFFTLWSLLGCKTDQESLVSTSSEEAEAVVAADGSKVSAHKFFQHLGLAARIGHGQASLTIETLSIDETLADLESKDSKARFYLRKDPTRTDKKWILKNVSISPIEASQTTHDVTVINSPYGFDPFMLESANPLQSVNGVFHLIGKKVLKFDILSTEIEKNLLTLTIDYPTNDSTGLVRTPCSNTIYFIPFDRTADLGWLGSSNGNQAINPLDLNTILFGQQAAVPGTIVPGHPPGALFPQPQPAVYPHHSGVVMTPPYPYLPTAHYGCSSDTVTEVQMFDPLGNQQMANGLPVFHILDPMKRPTFTVVKLSPEQVGYHQPVAYAGQTVYEIIGNQTTCTILPHDRRKTMAQFKAFFNNVDDWFAPGGCRPKTYGSGSSIKIKAKVKPVINDQHGPTFEVVNVVAFAKAQSAHGEDRNAVTALETMIKQALVQIFGTKQVDPGFMAKAIKEVLKSVIKDTNKKKIIGWEFDRKKVKFTRAGDDDGESESVPAEEEEETDDQSDQDDPIDDDVEATTSSEKTCGGVLTAGSYINDKDSLRYGLRNGIEAYSNIGRTLCSEATESVRLDYMDQLLANKCIKKTFYDSLKAEDPTFKFLATGFSDCPHS